MAASLFIQSDRPSSYGVFDNKERIVLISPTEIAISQPSEKVSFTVRPIISFNSSASSLSKSSSCSNTDQEVGHVALVDDVSKIQGTVADSTTTTSSSSTERSLPVSSHVQRLQPEPAVPPALTKAREYFAFLRSSVRTYASELRTPYHSVSAEGSFTHFIVSPLYEWFGRNRRVVLSQPLSRINLQPCLASGLESEGALINGTSFNYAGMYGIPPAYEELHRRCLDLLPVANSNAVQVIEETLRNEMASFLGMESCFLAPTGYQGNILAMTAILNRSWTVIMDRKSHSSLFAAVYLSGASKVIKFAHNDISELENTLDQLHSAADKHTNVMVIVEGMYSLDATLPDLDELAKLKQQHGFVLYCDEAHSFGSIGKSGKGLLEWWNDMNPHRTVPNSVIDVRTATFSKAIVGAGGFVCASGRFKQQIQARYLQLLAEGGETLATPVMLHAIWFLRQPQRLKRNLTRLRAMSLYVHRQLRAAGVFTYGDESAPIVPVHAGRPSKAAELSYALRQCGVAATPFSKPAVPMWQSRVRIGLSAEFSDDVVNGLVGGIIEACDRVGLRRELQQSTAPFQTSMEDESPSLKAEQTSVLLQLHALIDTTVEKLENPPQGSLGHSPRGREVLEAGHLARAQYGLGAGSSRWILGTYPPHLEVERRIAEILVQHSAMAYTNSEAGLMSTVAGLCRPLRKCAQHCFLVPSQASTGVENGLKIAPRKSGTEILRYQDWDDLVRQMEKLAAKGRTHVTLCLDTSVIDSTLAPRLGPLRRKFAGVTILWNDCTPNGLCYQRTECAKNGVFGALAAVLKARTLVYGSFYHAFGLNGGYLAGDATLLEELRYTSRCYVFTGASPPYVMAMVAEELRGMS